MNPQIKSTLTSFLMLGAGSIATLLANKGLIATSDENTFSTWLVSGALYAIAAGLLWYKQRQQSQKALAAAITPETAIAKINTEDNGLKVVPANGPGQAVSAPLKGSSQ